MVQVSRNRLALLYSPKRMVSPNFLRSLIFYITVYDIVRNYKERCCIHVNIQTVVTFLDIGTCTTCLRMYPLRIIHTLRKIQRRQGQYDTRTYNSGTTDWYCFFLLLAAVVVRLFAHDGGSCVFGLCCGVPLVLLQ